MGGILGIFLKGNGAIKFLDFVPPSSLYQKLSKNEFSEFLAVFFATAMIFDDFFPQSQNLKKPLVQTVSIDPFLRITRVFTIIRNLLSSP